jgi:hypothetical protein
MSNWAKTLTPEEFKEHRAKEAAAHTKFSCSQTLMKFPQSKELKEVS